ncbi:MAG: DegT/DnrJ/EryC1/StrS family aminotransferase [Lapillicoccus sp.]
MIGIPLVDLVAQQREIDEDVHRDLRAVFDRAGFVGGPDVAAFESEYAHYVGVEHCVGLGNGTDAVEFALRAVGVGPGAEVIIPANTFVATAEAVVRAGGRPVLVDVDPETLLMDPARVESAVTAQTAAVVPVHLFGRLVPVDKIAAAAPGVPMVEDAAQSQGARLDGRVSGGLGTIAATSFYPGKNLGAAGDAGAVTTADPALARAVRLLGAHGSEQKYVHEVLGFNSRLDAVQAVVLRHKLRRLSVWNEARREAAGVYDMLLADVEAIQRPSLLAGEAHVWHLYVVRVPERDTVLARLNAAGIGAGVHYPHPVHLTPAFSTLGHAIGDFPVSEEAAGSILSLPIFPHITREQQERVVSELVAAMA